MINTNYKELLIKYICHVGEQEGISFLRTWHREGYFTKE